MEHQEDLDAQLSALMTNTPIDPKVVAAFAVYGQASQYVPAPVLTTATATRFATSSEAQ